MSNLLQRKQNVESHDFYRPQRTRNIGEYVDEQTAG